MNILYVCKSKQLKINIQFKIRSKIGNKQKLVKNPNLEIIPDEDL